MSKAENRKKKQNIAQSQLLIKLPNATFKTKTKDGEFLHVSITCLERKNNLKSFVKEGRARLDKQKWNIIFSLREFSEC